MIRSAKDPADTRNIPAEVDLPIAGVAPGPPGNNVELDTVVRLILVVLGGVVRGALRTAQHVAVRVEAEP